jgi:hypothetical protein
MLDDVLRCFLRHSQYAPAAGMFTRVRSDADGFHREFTIATADVDSCWARLTEPRIAKSRGIDLFCNGNWPSGTAGSEETVSNMEVLSFMDKGLGTIALFLPGHPGLARTANTACPPCAGHREILYRAIISVRNPTMTVCEPSKSIECISWTDGCKRARG